jgi:starvation-inducible DNA-binding protein
LIFLLVDVVKIKIWSTRGWSYGEYSTAMRTINIGLSEEQRQGVVDLLNSDLSDAYLLLIKTKKYHWDVVGPQFRSLHEMWEEQYEALTANIDSIAERVRALGGYPVGTAEGFLKHASIKEHGGDVPVATEMVARLVNDHEQVIRNLRQHVDQCSEQYHDEGTADFLTGLMEQHEEMAWMLRSFIEGESLDSDGQVRNTQVKAPATV